MSSFKELASKEITNQLAVSKAMQSGPDGISKLVADKELIGKRVFEGFKLGMLTMALGSAIGGAAGSLIGLGPSGALLGGEIGLTGGAIKGQADANKEAIQRAGMSPGKINLARFAGGFNPAYAATSILPESGHIGLKNNV